MLNAKDNGLEPNRRFSLFISPETRKAIEICRQKLGFENKSMVVRRAIATYVNANLTVEEIEQLNTE